jgi:hypothetical protein
LGRPQNRGKIGPSWLDGSAILKIYGKATGRDQTLAFVRLGVVFLPNFSDFCWNAFPINFYKNDFSKNQKSLDRVFFASPETPSGCVIFTIFTVRMSISPDFSADFQTLIVVRLFTSFVKCREK